MIAINAIPAGMRQHNTVTIHQSLKKQYEAAIANPATPKALCSMIEQACLKWQSTISLMMARLTRRLDQHPAPARKSPKPAHCGVFPKQRSANPVRAVPQVSSMALLLPKLSAQQLKQRYPAKIPMKSGNLKSANPASPAQSYSLNLLVSDSTICCQNWILSSGVSWQTVCLHSGVEVLVGGQRQWVGMRRKGELRIRKAVTNQIRYRMSMVCFWQRPRLPTRSISAKQPSSSCSCYIQLLQRTRGSQGGILQRQEGQIVMQWLGW